MLKRWVVLGLLGMSWACANTGAVTPHTQSAAVAAPGGTTRFAVIGDYGLAGPEEKRVADVVHGFAPHYVLTLGDNNYPNGEADSLDRNIGQYYHDFIRFDATYTGAYSHPSPSGPNRFFPTLGNHDWRSPGARPYLDYFELPGNERYYKVRLGDVELFALDSDPHEPDGNTAHSVQGQWLQQALARSEAPWKVVTMHHPPYSSGDHGDTPVMQWPFKAWGADAVFAGHDHHYERLVVDGIPYFVVGLSGAEIRAAVPTKRPYATAHFTYDIKHGAVLLEAQKDTMKASLFTADNELIETYQWEKQAQASGAAAPPHS